MKINKNRLAKCIALTALLPLTSLAEALEKPKTMEEMWQIIQAQQKQIDEMKIAMKTEPNKTEATGTMKNLEYKTDVLSQEVEKLRTNLSIPEDAKYKSAYGLGPAASKIYQVGKGLSIGGYGEANYQANVGDKGSNTDNADLERLVLYAGYKFTDQILFNSEIEFEHGTTGEADESEGEVSVEFASLDFFIDPVANIRAGLVLMPMGFINPIHEPPFYFGNNRPEVERRIIPSTWREIGLGLFGQITPDLTYTAYAVSGLDAAEFSSNGIRDGRGGGSQAKAESFGYVARVDYTPTILPGITVGGSAYVGHAGQNQSFAGQQVDVLTQLYEGHLQWKYRGLEVRALGSWGHINNADLLSDEKDETIGSENYGWYTEVGYDILPLILPETTQYLAPFFRYEQLDTIAKAPVGFLDDDSKNRWIYQFGLQYKPIPNVVIKADYRNFNAKKGALADDFNLGLGFIF
jgi:opacity protein-like surface antigen